MYMKCFKHAPYSCLKKLFLDATIAVLKNTVELLMLSVFGFSVISVYLHFSSQIVYKVIFYRDKVEDLSSETERLKRSLTAKDEVERSQIEAIHQLTAKNKKFENEVSQLQSQLDDITQRYDTMKKSFEAAKKELVDKNRTSNELQAREQKLESLENEKRMTESQNEQVQVF